MACTIIAEAGVNHDGKLDKALKLCDVAKMTGADVVKFQTFDPRKLIGEDSKDFQALCRLALKQEDFLKIARHCENIGIEFCSTPDHVDDLKFLVNECGVRRIKLGSGSLLYRPLVDAAFDTGLPVLLSTGMATFHEVEQTVIRQFQRKKDVLVPHLTLMHCVSLYPCPLSLANVAALRLFGGARGWIWVPDLYGVGYSDHTKGTTAAMAAVALGATVIEKHFTMDCRDAGPDHAMSTEPWEFMHMVNDIREVECVLGHGRKEPSDEELAMIPRVRKDADGFQPGL